MNLFILRGLPGSGKSTWIRENGLSNITLSSDEYRMKMNGLVMKDGQLVISQKNQSDIWNKLYDDMDARLAAGSDVIVDATNVNPALFERYFDAARKYGAEIIAVNFPLTVEESIKRQSHRDFSYQTVPEHAIRRMGEAIKAPLPDEIKSVTPDEALGMLSKYIQKEENIEL